MNTDNNWLTKRKREIPSIGYTHNPLLFTPRLLRGSRKQSGHGKNLQATRRSLVAALLLAALCIGSFATWATSGADDVNDFIGMSIVRELRSGQSDYVAFGPLITGSSAMPDALILVVPIEEFLSAWHAWRAASAGGAASLLDFLALLELGGDPEGGGQTVRSPSGTLHASTSKSCTELFERYHRVAIEEKPDYETLLRGTPALCAAP